MVNAQFKENTQRTLVAISTYSSTVVHTVNLYIIYLTNTAIFANKDTIKRYVKAYYVWII